MFEFPETDSQTEISIEKGYWEVLPGGRTWLRDEVDTILSQQRTCPLHGRPQSWDNSSEFSINKAKGLGFCGLLHSVTDCGLLPARGCKLGEAAPLERHSAVNQCF